MKYCIKSNARSRHDVRRTTTARIVSDYTVQPGKTCRSPLVCATSFECLLSNLRHRAGPTIGQDFMGGRSARRRRPAVVFSLPSTPPNGSSITAPGRFWVEAFAPGIEPRTGIERFRAHGEHDLPGASFVPKKGAKHLIRQAGVLLKPFRQILDQCGTSFSIASPDTFDKSRDTLPRSVVASLVPGQQAITGRPHEPFLMGKMILNANGEVLRQIVQLT
jgi:hypothetical protein